MSDKRLEGLDLNLLLALHWLLTERNVTAAANRLGMSQPAASRALSRLRHAFDDPLLVKSGAVMTPTPVAERLQPAVAHAIDRCRDVLRMSERFDPAHEHGRFRIACVDYVGAILASCWIEYIQPQAPNLALDFVNPTLAAAQDMVSGKIDMTFLPEASVLDLPPSVDTNQFITKSIFDVSWKTAIRKGHPLANRTMTAEDFCSYGHILVTPDNAKLGVADRALAEQGLSRHIAFRTSTFLLALTILQKTDCLITAPEGLLRLDQENVEIVDPPLRLSGFKMLASWHPNWDHDERHKWVREQLHRAGTEMMQRKIIA